MKSMLLVGIVVGTLLAVSPTAGAVDHLEQAKRLTAEMKYMQALWAINVILKSKKSEPRELITALQLQGMCLSALGKKRAAVNAYGRLLAIDPDHELPAKISPKLRQNFDTARKLMMKKKPLQISLEPPGEGKKIGGALIVVKVGANPFRLVRRLRLVYRADEQKTKSLTKTLKRGKVVKFKLPKNLKAETVTYHIRALNRYGGTVVVLKDGQQEFQLGSTKVVAAASAGIDRNADLKVADDGGTTKTASTGTIRTDVEKKAYPTGAEPHVPEPGSEAVDIEDMKDKPADDDDANMTAWYETWWFWTGVGVVLAGTATGIALGVTSGGSSGDMRYEVFLR